MSDTVHTPLSNAAAEPEDGSSALPPPVLDSGMETGIGADDEPALSIADKAAPPPDPDGDGVLTPDEAKKLLGG